MNIGKKMQNELNKQINMELYSAYLYLSAATYLDSVNLKGFAHWMKVQAHEEVGHAMRIYGYLNDRGGRVLLSSINAPKTQWKNAQAVFQDAYEHEQKITGLINKLVELSRVEKDYATESMLKWFVDEQVEEESSVSEILEHIKMTDCKVNGLLIIDMKLGERKNKKI